MYRRRNLLSVAVTLLTVCLMSTQASAVFFTTEADVDANVPTIGVTPGTPSPLPGVERIVIDGRTYTNTYAPGAGGSINAPGAKVRTIFAAEIQNARNGINHTPVRGPGDDGNVLVVIAALDGTLEGPANQLARFDSGRAGLFTVAGNTFQSADPETWGFDDAAFAAGMNPGSVAEWILAPPDTVAQDNGAFIMIDGNDVNTSSANATAAEIQTQGRFLFFEDSTGPLALDQPLDPGDDFIMAMPSAGVAPFVQNEGFAATSDLDVESNLDLAAIMAEGLTLDSADDEDILNAIGIWAGLGSVGGGADNGFANFGSGGFDDWDPVFATVGGDLFAVNGDFRASGQPELFPGVSTVVPEPTTMLLGLAGLAALGIRRRRNA